MAYLSNHQKPTNFVDVGISSFEQGYGNRLDLSGTLELPVSDLVLRISGENTSGPSPSGVVQELMSRGGYRLISKICETLNTLTPIAVETILHEGGGRWGLDSLPTVISCTAHIDAVLLIWLLKRPQIRRNVISFRNPGQTGGSRYIPTQVEVFGGVYRRRSTSTYPARNVLLNTSCS